jgi:hypothetical protein
VIACLEAIDARKMHLQMGYSSLFEFATRELGYQEAQAYRRISAMRVIRELPDLKPELESGTLKLTTLTQASQFFRHEEKAGKPYTLEQKQDLLKNLMPMSSRECESKLKSMNPETPRPENARVISEKETEIRFTANQELMEDLKKLKNLWAHIQPEMKYAELIGRMAKMALAKADPEKRKTRAAKLERASESTRYIPVAVATEVWERDQGNCVFEAPHTGRKCGSTFMLELDHITPFAEGGPSTVENLRLHCRAHNQARNFFGAENQSGGGMGVGS